MSNSVDPNWGKPTRFTTRHERLAAEPDTYQDSTDAADVTTDANGRPTLAPAPKVLAGAVAGAVLVVVATMLTAVTPDLLSFAGPWAPVLFAGVGALAATLTAYIKRP